MKKMLVIGAAAMLLASVAVDYASAQRGGFGGGRGMSMGGGGMRGAAIGGGGGFRGAAIGGGGFRGASMGGFRGAPMGGGFRSAAVGGGIRSASIGAPGWRGGSAWAGSRMGWRGGPGWAGSRVGFAGGPRWGGSRVAWGGGAWAGRGWAGRPWAGRSWAWAGHRHGFRHGFRHRRFVGFGFPLVAGVALGSAYYNSCWVWNGWDYVNACYDPYYYNGAWPYY